MNLSTFYIVRILFQEYQTSGPDLRGVAGGPGPGPPTNRGPPTKPFIILLLTSLAFLARYVIYTSRAYATMSVSVCLSDVFVCL